MLAQYTASQTRGAAAADARLATHLELAVRVRQNVLRLQISVEHLSCSTAQARLSWCAPKVPFLNTTPAVHCSISMAAPAHAGLSRTCVNILQPPQHLVEEELVVLWSQIIIGLDHLQMQHTRYTAGQCSVVRLNGQCSATAATWTWHE